MGQREVRPVWNNALRTNHQNFSNSRRNFAPTAVLTKSGIVPISTVRQRSLLHDNIVPKPDLALELGKSISLTEAEEEAVAREVHATHARIVSESEPEPTQRRQSGIAFRDSFIVSKKRSSDSSKKLKGTGSKPGVPDEEKLILEWEADVDSEHFDRDDNAGDDNEETKPDPEEIYK
ncbi:hypothetical protein Tco_0047724 [Tanacetum coccineum]